MAELNIESTPPAEQQPPKKVTGKERDLVSSVLARVIGEDTRRVTELSHQVASNQPTEADSHRPITKKLTRPKKISKKADTDNNLGDSAGADVDVPSLNIMAPQTPVSTLMDSDDDFNSVASSNAFGMEAAEDSDISLPGGGESCKSFAGFLIQSHISHILRTLFPLRKLTDMSFFAQTRKMNLGS